MSWTKDDTERVAQSAIVSNVDICIPDSYKVSKWHFRAILKRIKELHPDCLVCVQRSVCGEVLEWATHNLCYALYFYRSHTKDVDLNYPQNFWEKMGYGLLGPIALIFIK